NGSAQQIGCRDFVLRAERGEAQIKEHVAMKGARERKIKCTGRRLLKQSDSGGGHDPDDLDRFAAFDLIAVVSSIFRRGLGADWELNQPAEGVTVREKFLGQRFVDDGD